MGAKSSARSRVERSGARVAEAIDTIGRRAGTTEASLYEGPRGRTLARGPRIDGGVPLMRKYSANSEVGKFPNKRFGDVRGHQDGGQAVPGQRGRPPEGRVAGGQGRSAGAARRGARAGRGLGRAGGNAPGARCIG